jgi:hypothetical protein
MEVNPSVSSTTRDVDGGNPSSPPPEPAEREPSNSTGIQLYAFAGDVEYKHLSSDPREIRVVFILQAANWTDSIQCRTVTLPLDLVQVMLPYRALSYVWGDVKDTLPIHLNGSIHHVTRNLESALRFCRHVQYSVLWVDALCINQSDPEERSSQVRIMKEIYTSSTYPTVVWLGPSPKTDPSSVDLNRTALIQWDSNYEQYKEVLERFRNRPDNQYSHTFFQISANEATKAQLVFDFIIRMFHGHHCYELPMLGFTGSGGDLDSNPGWVKLIEALKEFVENPWWQRMWILQESAVSNTVQFLWCGSSMEFSIMVEAAKSLERHKYRRCCFWPSNTIEELCDKFVQVVLRITLVREDLGKTYIHLPDIILSHSYRLATDPRDRVYALLGLCSVQGSEGGKNFEITYDLPIEEVYCRTATFSILDDDTLDVLLQAGGNHQLQSLPSWVPDWSIQYSCDLSTEASHRQSRIVANTDCLYDRNGSANAAFFGKDLLATGYFVDSIRIVGMPLEWGSKSEYQTILKWKKLVKLAERGDEKYPGGQCSNAEAFWRTMIGDSIMTITDEAEEAGIVRGRSAFRRAVEEDKALWADVLEYFKNGHYIEGDSKRLKEIQIQVNRFWDNTSLRTFFVTEKGYFGVGPIQMQRHDHVLHLSGARVPFILREIGAKEVTIPAETNFWMSGVTGTMPSAMMATQELKICGQCYELIGDCYTHGVMYYDDWFNQTAKSEYSQRIFIM